MHFEHAQKDYVIVIKKCVTLNPYGIPRVSINL